MKYANLILGVILLAVSFNPVGVGANERNMFNDLNKLRSRLNLAPLEIDPLLMLHARKYAKDMRDFQSVPDMANHTSPNYGTFMDRVERDYRPLAERPWYAENIAAAPTERHAFTNFTNSPGHYGTMVNPKATQVGIGMAEGGLNRQSYVQHFSDKKTPLSVLAKKRMIKMPEETRQQFMNMYRGSK